ncbi:hypothetical protein PCE1_000585 [Barthelona sp. PCE]
MVLLRSSFVFGVIILVLLTRFSYAVNIDVTTPPNAHIWDTVKVHFEGEGSFANAYTVDISRKRDNATITLCGIGDDLLSCSWNESFIPIQRGLRDGDNIKIIVSLGAFRSSSDYFHIFSESTGLSSFVSIFSFLIGIATFVHTVYLVTSYVHVTFKLSTLYHTIITIHASQFVLGFINYIFQIKSQSWCVIYVWFYLMCNTAIILISILIPVVILGTIVGVRFDNATLLSVTVAVFSVVFASYILSTDLIYPLQPLKTFSDTSNQCTLGFEDARFLVDALMVFDTVVVVVFIFFSVVIVLKLVEMRLLKKKYHRTLLGDFLMLVLVPFCLILAVELYYFIFDSFSTINSFLEIKLDFLDFIFDVQCFLILLFYYINRSRWTKDKDTRISKLHTEYSTV